MNGHTRNNIKTFVDDAFKQFSDEDILDLKIILSMSNQELVTYYNKQSLEASRKLEGINLILLDPSPLKAENDDTVSTFEIRNQIYAHIKQKIAQVEEDEEQKLAKSNSIPTKLFYGFCNMITFFNDRFRAQESNELNYQQDNQIYPHLNLD